MADIKTMFSGNINVSADKGNSSVPTKGKKKKGKKK